MNTPYPAEKSKILPPPPFVGVVCLQTCRLGIRCYYVRETGHVNLEAKEILKFYETSNYKPHHVLTATYTYVYIIETSTLAST